ncbi:MAG: flagellar basal-body rod protein FlgF [Desulfobacterales bacterium]|nr:flagellar basal-body rod protein FlgF [Desulfobacterales bacterium]
MSEAIYTVGSGSILQQMRLEVLANNLANVNSSGYKIEQPIFKAFMPGDEENGEAVDPETGQPSVMAKNYHVEFVGTRIDFTKGQLKKTGSSLDFALLGNGFFSVQTPEGVEYTRSGAFSLNGEGVLVTHDGKPVMGEGGEIRIDGSVVTVDEAGAINVDGVQAGRFAIVDFEDRNRLQKVGHTRFRPEEDMDPIPPDDNLKIKQAYLELSNVNVIKSMSEMIDVLRTYEAQQKTIKAVTDMNMKAINDVGRPG